MPYFISSALPCFSLELPLAPFTLLVSSLSLSLSLSMSLPRTPENCTVLSFGHSFFENDRAKQASKYDYSSRKFPPPIEFSMHRPKVKCDRPRDLKTDILTIVPPSCRFDTFKVKKCRVTRIFVKCDLSVTVRNAVISRYSFKKFAFVEKFGEKMIRYIQGKSVKTKQCDLIEIQSKEIMIK